MSSLFSPLPDSGSPDPNPDIAQPDSDSSAAVPRMGAERGYGVADESEITPLRTGGFVCLILGVLSFFATIAWQMLVLPVIAIGFGVFAMRKWTGTRPVGTSAAVIGLMLAFAFGSYGFWRPYLKHRTQSQQAVYFARQFFELVGRGDRALALELRKSHVERQPASVDLEKVYSMDAVAMGQMLQTSNVLLSDVMEAGTKPTWELTSRPRVYVQYRNEKVDTYWRDTSGHVGPEVQVLMKWVPEAKSGTGQWQVELFQHKRERLVAESVL